MQKESLSSKEKQSWNSEGKICSWLKFPPTPGGPVQGGSDAPKQHPGHQGQTLEHSVPPKGILNLSVTDGFSWEKVRIPWGRGWCKATVSAPFEWQKKGSSCSLLGLPEGFMAELSPLLRFWHPDLGSWIVSLHLEHCFLALVLGDYCLQFPSDRCLKEQYWAGRGGKASLGYLCAVVWVTKHSTRQRKRLHETALGVALTGIKAPRTAVEKAGEQGSVFYSSSLRSDRVQTILFIAFPPT